jgi:hypothetical protein
VVRHRQCGGPAGRAQGRSARDDGVAHRHGAHRRPL